MSAAAAPADAKAKRKRKAPKALIAVFAFLIPVLLLGGATAGHFLGWFTIPFLPKPPAKAAAAQAEDKKEEEAEPKAEEEAPKPAAEAPKPAPPAARAPQPTPQNTIDREKGAEAIAEVWGGLKGAQLAEISANYAPGDLARIISKMDARKAAELLAALEPERAGAVSREIERQASIVPPEGS
jgi:hypothetical protein